MAKSKVALERVVVVDGCRTPFLRSSSDFTDLSSYDLARHAIVGLLDKSGVDPAMINYLTMGCVIQDVNTSNVAREAAMAAGIPKDVPAHTVSQACISANQAVVSAANLIAVGQADIAIAGGTETASDVPIRYKRSMRKRFMATQKYRKPGDWTGFLRGFKLSDLAPEVPAITEFSTGLTMGQSCDRVTSMVGITRAQQDEFAHRSHMLADQSTKSGWFDGEIVPVSPPPSFHPVKHDNGPRGDSSLDKMGKLRPAFSKPFGTATAANSSFLTDGASAVLLMSESKAAELGFTPLAAIKSYAFSGNDNNDELLLGPYYSTPKALDRAGLSAADIDVVEIHEAFSGSVLAALKLLADDGHAFAIDKVNNHGGSLSIGHPFGATGTRLVISACRRLHDEDATFALLTACAAGGLGHAMILERI